MTCNPPRLVALVTLAHELEDHLLHTEADWRSNGTGVGNMECKGAVRPLSHLLEGIQYLLEDDLSEQASLNHFVREQDATQRLRLVLPQPGVLLLAQRRLQL